MGILDLPDQSSWPAQRVGMWAPGEYLVTCSHSKTVYLGNKRSRHCWPCAQSAKEKAPVESAPGEYGQVYVEAWVGWHLGKDGRPAPMICDHNPGHLAHVTRYRFQVPPDVLEHLAGTRECLMLDKFGNMQKDCRNPAEGSES